MIVLPDGKVCRNLPEQVAENLNKIQEIIHFLDGVNIQDNLVVIADLSQILTAAELEIVERPVAFVYYNDQLYIKKNEDSGNAYFDNVFSLTASASQIDFASNEIAVDLSTGALSMTSATATTYPKSQIDSLLAAKADLAGATFTGAVKALTLEQDQANYSLDATPTLSSGDIANGLTLTPVYNRFEVIGNALYLVSINIVNNPTAASVAFGSLTSTASSIDPVIGSKIYDINGQKVSELGSGQIDIFRGGTAEDGYGYGNVRINLTHNAQNSMRMLIQPESTINIHANSALKVFARTFLTLL